VLLLLLLLSVLLNVTVLEAGFSLSWLLQPEAAANEKQRVMPKTSGPPALRDKKKPKRKHAHAGQVVNSKAVLMTLQRQRLWCYRSHAMHICCWCAVACSKAGLTVLRWLLMGQTSTHPTCCQQR
jgi:hypothetical protein